MPQGNLETLVSACAGGSCDRKIACETLATDDGGDDRDKQDAEEEKQEEVPPDYPPESFWLSKDAEFDWFDRNAFYERKESQKGNSVSNSTNLNPSLHPNSNSTSQRFSVKKSKASIIGLPKPQKSCYVDAKSRRNCKPGNTRLFPKRSGSVNKSDPPVVEPSSPKVSCMGRVRSRRDRNRRLKSRQNSAKAEKLQEKPTERRKNSLFSGFRSIFRSKGKGRCKHARDVEPDSLTKTSDIRTRLPPGDTDAAAWEELPSPARCSLTAEPPSLGGMMKFASGRRSGPLI